MDTVFRLINNNAIVENTDSIYKQTRNKLEIDTENYEPS